MPIDERSISLPEQWAKDAQTVIPAPPVPGIAYRNTAITPEQWAHGQDYSRVADSAQWNQMFWTMSGLLKFAEQYGVMPYSPFTDYPESGICMGPDGILYQAVQPSGPNNGGAQPITNKSYWLNYVTKLVTSPYTLGEFYYFRHPTMKPGFAAAQGGLIGGAYQGKDITEYPIWDYLQTAEGRLLCKTEAEWQAMTTAIWHTTADGTAIGWDGIGGAPYYVQDLGAGTLRMPDLRGMYAEAAGFESLGAGDVDGDRGRRLYGYTLPLATASSASGAGCIRTLTHTERRGEGEVHNDALYRITIDNSLTMPIGPVFAPRRWGALACAYLGRPSS